MEFGWFTAVKPRGSQSMNPRLLDTGVAASSTPASVHQEALGGSWRRLRPTSGRTGANLSTHGGSPAEMIAAGSSPVRGTCLVEDTTTDKLSSTK